MNSCYALNATTERGSKQDKYLRFSHPDEKLDESFTRPFKGAWKGSPEAVDWIAKTSSSGLSIPSLYLPKNGKLYLMNGSTYVRCTLATHTVDEGFPKSIGSYWTGMKAAGFDSGIDSALWWDEKTAYFFKGDKYVKYDLEADKVADGYPRTIGSYWTGFKDAGFGSGIDAFIRWDNEKAYAFKGDRYIRFNVTTDKLDQLPRKITDHWSALAQADVPRVLTMWQAPAVESKPSGDATTKEQNMTSPATTNPVVESDEFPSPFETLVQSMANHHTNALNVFTATAFEEKAKREEASRPRLSIVMSEEPAAYVIPLQFHPASGTEKLPQESKKMIEIYKESLLSTLQENEAEVTKYAEQRKDGEEGSGGISLEEFTKKMRQRAKKNVEEYARREYALAADLIPVGKQKPPAQNSIAAAFEAASRFFTHVWNSVAQFFTQLVETITNWLKAAFEKIKEFFAGVVANCNSYFKQVFG
ncbi:hemopexin repeat-containing protein [Streptomyces sp. NPDC050485]|uniref:hemopexin repeat-containing protein n=1 Tax=Streptomyces sp. NPDC050485 TaxID=3365617 RepID=UPI0037BC5397